MSKKPVVQLRPDQRRRLLQFVKSGKRKAREILYAYLLLRSADGWSETEVAKAFDVSPRTVRRIRFRCRADGLNAALHEQPGSGQPAKLTLRQETLLVALACSQPPAGRQRWTVRLLTEQALKRKIVKMGQSDSLSGRCPLSRRPTDRPRLRQLEHALGRDVD